MELGVYIFTKTQRIRMQFSSAQSAFENFQVLDYGENEQGYLYARRTHDNKLITVEKQTNNLRIFDIDNDCLIAEYEGIQEDLYSKPNNMGLVLTFIRI